MKYFLILLTVILFSCSSQEESYANIPDNDSDVKPKLEKSEIVKVIVCNTINVRKEQIFEKLEIISVANVFGEAIKRIIDGTSLSSMFRELKG